MDQIDCPSEHVWDARQAWFESVFDVDKRGGGYLLGEHATGLLVDLQSIFCAGAFVSVIVISCTVIDAHLREAELGPSFEGGLQAAFGHSEYKNELDWLRRRRNELVHYKYQNSLAVSVEDHWTKRAEHEAEARRAVKLVAEVLFSYPFV